MIRVIMASGPVIVENGKVLLNKHGDTKFWKFCGGLVGDYHQDLIAWAKLKAKEEMGLHIEILNIKPYIFFTRKETQEGIIDVILVHFLAKRVNEIKPGTDILEWKWLDISNLPIDGLAPNIIPALHYFKFI